MLAFKHMVLAFGTKRKVIIFYAPLSGFLCATTHVVALVVVSIFFINIELCMILKHIVLDFGIKMNLIIFYVPSSGSRYTTAHLVALLVVSIGTFTIFFYKITYLL